MAEISGFSSLGNVNAYLDRFLAADRKPIDTLKEQKTQFQNQANIYSDLKQELVNLRDRVKSFTSYNTSFLSATRNAVSSNESIFTAEASENAEFGVHTIEVKRIATRDTAVSDKISGKSSSLAKKYFGGSQSFKISLENGSESIITIDFNDKNETNKDVLDRISSKINESGIDVTASVVKVDKNNYRLVTVAKETGASNAITFADEGESSLLANSGLVEKDGEREESSSSKGGYISTDSELLDANFVVNGVEITQDSNTVDGIVKGITLNLFKAQDEAGQTETLSITPDEEFLSKEINAFVDDYNKVIKYLNSKTSIDRSSNTRGALAGNYAIQQLKFNLRGSVTGRLEGFEDKEFNSLSGVGIEIQRDGTLKVADEDKLSDALTSNSSNVQELFTSDEGFAAILDTQIEKYTKTGGVLTDKQKGITNKIKNIDYRVERFNKRIERKETSLRRQYTNLQKVLSSLTTQQNLIQQIQSSFSGFGLSSGQNYGLF